MRIVMLLFVVCWIVPSGGTAPAADPNVVGPLVIKLIDEVQVPALEQGALRSLDVQLGDRVEGGQVIARLDDRDSVAERDLAMIELGISRQKSSQYREDRIAEMDFRETQAALDQQRLVAKMATEKSESDVRVSAAEKAEAVAKNEWSRAEAARKKYVDSVSTSELENLRLKSERARLERVQAMFERRMDRLNAESEAQAVRVAEIASQKAGVRQAVAEANAELLRLDVASKEKALALREQNVARHRVTSPIDGIVVEIHKRGGEWVRPGDPVVRVINLDHLHAEGFISGNTRPKRGDKVRIRSPETTVEGTIDFVSSERDLVSGEFRFLVRIEGAKFLPGDRVEIEW